VFILPYGHDQSVYGRPWATWALIALNALVFAYTWIAGMEPEDEVEEAAAEALEVHDLYPDARIDRALVDRAPERVREILTPWVRADDNEVVTDGDLALEDAVQGLLDALDRVPAYKLGYRPGDPSALTFLTSTFVHADIWHLLGNMLFLWLAGAVIECFWGVRAYAALYALAGFVATIAHHVAFPDSQTPLVGASGAISGMLGAFVVGYPKTRVRLLYGIFPIGMGHVYLRAWLLIPIWAAIQVLWAFVDLGDGTAHWAHVGGFFVGVAAAIVMKRLDWVIEDAGDGRPGPP
jgi:membrane associated rhomboid family serine protease